MSNKPDEKKKQVLKRLQQYCAKEDRSEQKIREKLYIIDDLSTQDQEEIVVKLLEDHFLDDARFTETYIRSKINQKRWGRQKIRHGLIRHRISGEMINRGMAEMNHKAYLQNLKFLLEFKQKSTDDPVALMRYLLQKGYEYEEIQEVLGD